MIDFEHSYNISSALDLKCDCSPEIMFMNFRITGSGDIEIKTDIKLKTSVCEIQTYKSVCYAFADEDKKITKDNAAVVIYYAKENESIWDIARQYGSCVGKIVDENNLSDETLNSKTVLVIPV